MKAKELAALLLENPEAEVYKTYPYGDHCHQTAAIDIDDPTETVIKPWAGGDTHRVIEDGNGDTFETVDEWREWADDEWDENDAKDAKSVICI